MEDGSWEGDGMDEEATEVDGGGGVLRRGEETRDGNLEEGGRAGGGGGGKVGEGDSWDGGGEKERNIENRWSGR